MFYPTRVLSSTKVQYRIRAIQICVVVLGLTCSAVLLKPRPATAQTGPIVLNDFEDGTLQEWIPRGEGVVLTNTTEAARTGSHSLKTTGRTAGFHGPSLNVLGKLLKGATYQVSASVRLVTGQPASMLKITVQRTPVDGANQFDQVASSADNGVTDAAWVTLQGQYSFGTDVTGLLLYIESSDPTSQYYLDDFSITLLAPPPGGPQDTSGLTSTFETNTAEGWQPRIGRETLTVTSDDKHDGNFSLLTTGRQREFDGARINVTNKVYNGSRYRVSLWAKLAPGESPINMRVSLERTLGSTTTFHTVIPNTQVTADQWVLLTAMYDYAFNHTTLNLYVETVAVTPARTPSFYIDDFNLAFIPPPEIEKDIPSVAETLSEFFPVGAAITPTEIAGVHGDLLKKHFNSITAGNAMKWDSLQPAEGAFNFTTADALANFAKANKMLIRGHTLVWHNQTPAWVFRDAAGNNLEPTPENKALMLQRLENHIRAVVSHYKDDVYAWDVVNEVIDPQRPDGFRRSAWFMLTGTDYIDTAFRVAHEVAPNAKLYINDYSTTDSTKRAFLYNLVRDLKSRGVPVDGVGHQMHNNIDYPSVASIVETINMFSELGVDNQITELDVSVYNNSTSTYPVVPEEILIRQGYKYRDFFQAFRQLKGKISSVTLWGLADDNTWLKTFPITRLDLPLLFDESLKAKHAYWGIIDPLRLPGADILAGMTVDSDNVLSGQPITYNITVSNNGHDPAPTPTLVDTIPQGTVFQSLVAPSGWSCLTPPPGGAGQISCKADSLAVGDSAQFKLTVAAVCATSSGAEIVNSALATSATGDPNPEPNNTASARVRVLNQPPVISGLTVDKLVIFPANGRMVNVALKYNINDNCDVGLVPSIKISSNENPAGDENSPDWQVIDAHHILLRAEHAPFSTGGRTYTITLTVTDSAGLSDSSSIKVKVLP